MDIGSLASILRMSTKYEVTFLRKLSITALQRYYPTTLKAYDEARPLRATYEASKDSRTRSQLFRLANVCRETGPNVLLATVLACCAQRDMREILCGISVPAITAPDGGVASTAKSLVELDPTNKVAVIQSRHQFCAVARSRNWHALFFGCQDCRLPTCASSRRSLTRYILKGRPTDGFATPFVVAEDLFSNLTLCEKCGAELHECCEMGRSVAWGMLPEVLVFKSWELIMAEHAQEDA